MSAEMRISIAPSKYLVALLPLCKNLIMYGKLQRRLLLIISKNAAVAAPRPFRGCTTVIAVDFPARAYNGITSLYARLPAVKVGSFARPDAAFLRPPRSPMNPPIRPPTILCVDDNPAAL